MKFGAALVFAFLFTLLLFTYGVEAGKNKDTKERERRRKDRRDKRREQKIAIDNNPTILSDPTFPVPTVSPINGDVFGDPILEATKRPHRHNHKSRGKDKREKAKKHKKDRERRREKGTGQVAEPEIVSFDDMLTIGGEDPTDPAPAPAPTSKEDKMTEEVPVDLSANVTNLLDTTEEIDDMAGENLKTTVKITDEPTPTPTFQAETQTERRRGREGKKDKKNKDKRKNKEQRREQLDEELQDIEIMPTEFEFSPTIQPELQTTTTQEPRRNERRKNKEERKKDKRGKKKSRLLVAPEDAEEIAQRDNGVIPSPESETQTDVTEAQKSHSKKDKDKRNRNQERQTNAQLDVVEMDTKKKDKDRRNKESNGERRDRVRHEKGVRKDKRKDKERLREPFEATNSSTLDECKSDRECTQGSCCELHEGSKICREYSHQEGQKCRDSCACHTGLVCQAPEPTRRSQRNKKLGPSRCRVPGINGMGGDFVGIVQDALEDVMDTMKKRDRNN